MNTAPSLPTAWPVVVFLSVSLSLAGLVHLGWLCLPWSKALAVPLDGSRTFRGRRFLGENKTLRGLVAMPVATAMIFFAAQRLDIGWPAAWSLASAAPSWAIGLAAGAGFMLAELPNSFAKRQLGIAPGQAAREPIRRWVFLLADRIDSTLGALFAMSLLVPLPLSVWVSTLLIGVALHALFSVALHRLGKKTRPL